MLSSFLYIGAIAKLDIKSDIVYIICAKRACQYLFAKRYFYEIIL